MATIFSGSKNKEKPLPFKITFRKMFHAKAQRERKGAKYLICFAILCAFA